jgi:hypothetical protein
MSTFRAPLIAATVLTMISWAALAQVRVITPDSESRSNFAHLSCAESLFFQPAKTDCQLSQIISIGADGQLARSA